MCDGSLHRDGKTVTLHTQCWDYMEQCVLAASMYHQWGWRVTIRRHKTVYWCVEIPPMYSRELRDMVSPWMLS